MTGVPVLVRDAVPEDAESLLAIWTDFTSESDRPKKPATTVVEVARSVARLGPDPTERLVVAELDSELVGVAHLRRAPISPIHDEDAVHVSYLHVLSGRRRRGVGTQLLEAAADWADEKDTKNIVASVAAASRDSNRFLARLGMAQVAVVRATPVACLRGKLTVAASTPIATNLIAARRLMRRRRSVD
ncbi:MAG: GNAT family N-acetyltransferase [Nocardioidaceae bacterium]